MTRQEEEDSWLDGAELPELKPGEDLPATVIDEQWRRFVEGLRSRALSRSAASSDTGVACSGTPRQP